MFAFCRAGIRGLFSPIYNEPVFADYIGHSDLTRYVCGFTGCKTETELGLGTVVAFVNPRDDDYTIGWHRDGGGTEGYGRPDHDVAAERQKWQAESWPDRSPGAPRTPEARKGVGFQLALLDSDAFEVVPGELRRSAPFLPRRAVVDAPSANVLGAFRVAQALALGGGVRSDEPL